MRRLEPHRPMTFARAGHLLGLGSAAGLLLCVIWAISL